MGILMLVFLHVRMLTIPVPDLYNMARVPSEIVHPNSSYSDLPECDHLHVSITPDSETYKRLDTLKLIVRNLTADSVLFSIGLGGYHKEWETVADDLSKFLQDNGQSSGSASIETLSSFDSLSIAVPLSKLRSKKHYTKWCFYIQGFRPKPILDYSCYWQSRSFIVK